MTKRVTRMMPKLLRAMLHAENAIISVGEAQHVVIEKGVKTH